MNDPIVLMKLTSNCTLEIFVELGKRKTFGDLAIIICGLASKLNWRFLFRFTKPPNFSANYNSLTSDIFRSFKPSVRSKFNVVRTLFMLFSYVNMQSGQNNIG